MNKINVLLVLLHVNSQGEFYPLFHITSDSFAHCHEIKVQSVILGPNTFLYDLFQIIVSLSRSEIPALQALQMNGKVTQVFLLPFNHSDS